MDSIGVELTNLDLVTAITVNESYGSSDFAVNKEIYIMSYGDYSLSAGERGKFNVGPLSDEVAFEVSALGDVDLRFEVYYDILILDREPEDKFGDYKFGKFYIDISVSNVDNVDWPINVEISFANIPLGTDIALFYYNKTCNCYMRCSSSGVTGNILWANVTKEEYLAGVGNAFAVFYKGAAPVPVPEVPLTPVLLALLIVAFLTVIRKRRDRF